MQWYVENDRTYIKTSKNENFKEYCSEFFVSKTLCNIVTQKRFAEITLLADGEEVKIILPMAIAKSDSAVSHLVNYGLDVEDSEKARYVVKTILSETEKTAPIEYFHNVQGFAKIGKYNVFAGPTMLGHPEKESSFLRLEKNSDGTYSLKTPFEQSGSLGEWREGIKKFIKGNIPLQLAVIVGVSSVVSAYLQRIGLVDCTIIVTFIGRSSTGKTSSAMVSASEWGPVEIGKGVIQNFRLTENNLIGTMADNNGVLACFDEATATRMQFDEICYDLSSSVSKGRCDSAGTPISRKSWSGTVLFTSEIPVLSKTSGTKGLLARVSEIHTMFTESAEQAEDIKEFLYEHHGTAWEPFAQAFLEKSRDEIRGAYKEILKRVLEKVEPKSGVERRVCKSYAVLILTAQIASEAWDIKFDIDGIADFLVGVFHANIGLCDRGSLIHERLIDEILRNLSHFCRPAKDQRYGQEFGLGNMWGTIEDEIVSGNTERVFWITKSGMQNLTKEFQNTSVEEIIDDLKDVGAVIKKDGRAYMKHTFCGFSSKGFCIMEELPKSEEELAKEKTAQKQFKKERKHHNVVLIKARSSKEDLIFPDEEENERELDPFSFENEGDG